MQRITSDTIHTYVDKLIQNSYASGDIAHKLISIQKFISWAYYSDRISFTTYQQIKDEIDNISTQFGESPSIEASNTISSQIVDGSGETAEEKKHFFDRFFKRAGSQDNSGEEPEPDKVTTDIPSTQNRPFIFISLALLILALSIIGQGIYTRFFSSTKATLAYPSTPVVASRILSFQGRLTDSLGNPIVAATNMRFRLYTASSGGSTLYDSGTCSISPDQDGVHNVLIGSDCGAEIASSVFTENSAVYLGVTVGSDSEMTPRQRIANVPYAQNSETLQGFPLGTEVSTVPYINNGGDLLIAAASPQIASTYASQAFVISSAQAVSLQSAGAGDVTLTATGSGELKFLVGGATAGVVNNSGNWGIKSSNPATFELQVNGDVGPETDSTFDLGSNSVRWANIYADNLVGTISPGFTAGSVTFADGSGNLAQDNAQFFWDDTNNKLGVGTAVPLAKFHLTGAATGKALAILNETGDQNILTASASGVTVANLDRSGNLSVEGALSDLSGATLDVSDNLDISGTLTSGTANAFTVDATGNISTSGTTGLTFSSTGGVNLAGGTLSDSSDGVDINDDLEIAGATTLGDNTADTVTANASSWTFANDTNYILSGGINGFSLDSTTFSVDATNDRIGLGTAAPDAAWLDIAANTTAKSQLNLTTSAGTNVSAPNSGDLWWNGTNLYFYNGSINKDLLASGGSVAGSDGQVQYNNGGAFGGASAFIYDDTNNRIGIGTATTPTTILHVAGATTGKALSIFDETGDQAIITASASGVTRYTLSNNGNITYSPSAYGAPITLYASDTTLPNSNTGIVDAINDAYTAAIGGGGGLWTDSATTTYLTTTTDDLVLGGSSPLSSAKFSIDGDADQIQLIVQGNATQTTNLATFEQSDGTDVLTITNGGNLSVEGAINDISGNLSLNDNTDITGNLTISGTTQIGDNGADTVTVNSAAWTFANDTDFTLSGGVNGLSFDGTTFSVDATGNKIGIGNAAPVAKLDVSGAVTGKALAIFNETGDQDILVGSASGNTRFRVANDGTVYGGYFLDISNPLYGIDPAATSNFGGYSMKITGGALLAYNDGNVGIGNQTPEGKLDVKGAATGKALTILDETGDQNILTASASGTTVANLDRSGNLAIEGALSDLSGATLAVNDNLDVSGTLTSGTADAFQVDATGNISTSGTTGLTFTAAGGVALAGGTISDSTDEVDINDSLAVSSILQVGSTGAAAYSRFGTNSTGHTLSGADALLVSGALEVDGMLYADAGITASDVTCTDCLDFAEFEDTLDVDATTDINLGANNLTIDLDSSGIFDIRDGATTFVSFDDDSTIDVTFPAAGTLGIDAAATDNTTTAGVINLDVDTATSGNIGSSIDYQVVDSAGNVTGYGEKIDVTVDTDAAQSHTVNGSYIGLTANDASSTTYGLHVVGEDAGGQVATAGILIENLQATDIDLTTGLLIRATTDGSLPTAVDASDAEITTALAVGANTISGTTGLIDYTNFDVDASGNTTIAGTTGLTFSSTGGVNLAGGVLIDSSDGVDINDNLEISGGTVSLTANGDVIDWGSDGAADPSTSSVGWKTKFYGDAYGLGVAGSTLWAVSDDTFKLYDNDSTTYNLKATIGTNTDTYFQLYDDSLNEDIRFHTNGTSWFNGGGLVIGATATSARFQVVGDESRFGTAGTITNATGDGDVYIQDALETDGIAYFSGGTVNLDNASSDLIDWGSDGAADPSTSSTGWKTKFYGNAYGFGVAGGAMWAVSDGQYRWYDNDSTTYNWKADLDTETDASLELYNNSIASTILLNTNGSSYLNGGNVGVGTSGPDAKIDSLATSGEQLRLTYTDGSVYTGFTVASTGDMTIDATGNDIMTADRVTIGSATAGVGKLNVTGAETGKALTILNETGDQDIFVASSGGTTRLRISNAGHVLPGADDSYDLGSSTLRFRDQYLGPGSLHIGTNGNEGIIDYDTTANWFEFNPSGDGSEEATLSDAGALILASTLDVNGDIIRNDTNLSIEATGYTRIGDSGTPGSASGDDDLYVLSDIEADGVIYADGGITATGTVSATDFACTDCLDFAEFEDTLDLDAALTLNQSTNDWTQNYTGTTTTGFTYNANSITTGTAMAINSTATTFSSGTLLSLDWSPGSLNTNGDDLFKINTTTNGNMSGYYINLLKNSASVFSIDQSGSFIAAGDANIKGSTTIGDAGVDNVTVNAKTWTFANDTDFVLSGGTNGLSFDSSTFSVDATNNRVGIGTTAPSEALEVAGNILIGAQSDSTPHTFASGCNCSLNSAAGTFGSETSRDAVTDSAVYKGKLFVAVRETDAAAIYRWDGGTTWQMVTNAVGKVNSGDTANIDSFTMTVYKDMLVIGSQGTGTEAALFYSTDAQTGSTPTWTQINTTKGTFNSANKPSVGDIAVYNGQLYFSTAETNLWELIRWNGGTNFTQINATDGKLLAEAAASIDDAKLFVYNNLLMIGGQSGVNNVVRVGAFDGITLTLLNTAGTIGSTGSLPDIGSMEVYNGDLYITVQRTDSASIWRWGPKKVPTSPLSTDFTIVSDGTNGKIITGDTQNIDTILLRNYNGHLYAVSQTGSATGTAALYEFGGQNTWTLVNTTRGTFGSESSIDNLTSIIEYNQIMYVGSEDVSSNVASVYSWTKTSLNSYALEFNSGNSNYGYINFIGDQVVNDNAQHGGSFMISHAIQLDSAGFDVAEDYGSYDQDLQANELVELDPDNREFVRRASKGTGGLIGVVSEDPGFRLGQSKTKLNGAKWSPIALVGRVPVKVTSENGAIKTGDPLTISSIPGVAMKATERGTSIGYAMENYDDEDPTRIGKITVFVNVGYNDKAIFAHDDVKDGSITESESGFSFTTASGKIINEVGAYSLLASAEIKAGFIHSTKLATQSFTAFQATIDNLVVDTLVGRQATLTDAQIENLNAQALKAQLIEADTIKTATLEAETTTISGSLSAKDASISGTLIADNVDAQNIREMRERLERLATTQSDTTVTSEQLNADIDQVQQYIDELTHTQTPPHVADVQLYQLSPSDVTIDPGTTENSLGQNVSSANLDSLTVTGTASMTSLTIADAFSTGNVFIQGNSVVSLVSDLKLSALDSVDIMNGAVIIAKDGTITAKGEIIAQKGIRTDTIKSVSGTSDVSVILDGNSDDPTGTNASQSAFRVQTQDGNSVAQIDSNGSADFRNLSLSSYNEATSSAVVIAAGDNYRQTGLYVPAIKTNAAANGNGILPQGENDIIIFNDSIKKDTIVNLTPTSSTHNQSVYVDKVETCANSSNELCKPYFRVAIDDVITTDVTFNWLIVN